MHILFFTDVPRPVCSTPALLSSSTLNTASNSPINLQLLNQLKMPTVEKNKVLHMNQNSRSTTSLIMSD